MVEKKEKAEKKAPAAKKTAEKAAAPKAAPKAKAAAPAKEAAATKAAPAAKAGNASLKTVTLTQIGSPIGRQSSQRATLIGLGLNKLHRTRTLQDTPSLRGMIEKVKHLLKIVAE